MLLRVQEASGTIGIVDEQPAAVYYANGHDEDTRRILIATGAVANITSSRISRERKRKIRIFQQSGYLSLDLAAGTGEFFRLRSDIDPLAVRSAPADITAFVDRIKLEAPDGEPLKLELESFISALKGNGPVVVTGEEGRLALGVALQIVKEIERTLPSLVGRAHHRRDRDVALVEREDDPEEADETAHEDVWFDRY